MTKPTLKHPTLTTYVYGYCLSLYLTITAYLAVTHHLLHNQPLMYLLAGLALVQFIVQLVFFLHMGDELKPRYRLFVFIFMIIIVVILVAGTLWIMANMNYHHPSTPNEINRYLLRQDNL